jgi:Putative peptidoglycan binding domain
MKNLTSLLIGCSLALSGAALAQQPVEQQSPSKGKRAPEKTHATEAKPGPNAAKPQERPAKQTGAVKERAGTNAQKPEMTPKREKAAGTETNVSGQPAGAPTPGAKQQAEQRRKGVKGAAAGAKTSATPAAAGAKATAAPLAPASPSGQRVKRAGAAKKPDPQQVQQIKSQHTNFRAQPKPQQVPAVTFNQSYRIQGSEQWQGPQYEVFRSYRPEWHDQGWYRSHYNRVELIGGGYYYWNNGYWYPAWGYDPSAAYYAYDAPIYVGHRAEPPDQVIADVQALLQQMGYYKGEVDGLLGPLTREALAAYQADQGLTTTAVIDEPTLDSLGLA